MPEPLSARLRLYTIPPSAPFLTTLARAVLNGDLPCPGGVKPDPLTQARAGASANTSPTTTARFANRRRLSRIVEPSQFILKAYRCVGPR